MTKAEVLKKEDVKGLKPCCWIVGAIDPRGNPVSIDSMRVEWSEKDGAKLRDELNAAVRPYLEDHVAMREGPFVLLECYLMPQAKKAPSVKRKTRKGKK